MLSDHKIESMISIYMYKLPITLPRSGPTFLHARSKIVHMRFRIIMANRNRTTNVTQ